MEPKEVWWLGKDDTYIFTCQAYFYNALKKPMELLWVFLEGLPNEQMTNCRFNSRSYFIHAYIDSDYMFNCRFNAHSYFEWVLYLCS